MDSCATEHFQSGRCLRSTGIRMPNILILFLQLSKVSFLTEFPLHLLVAPNVS